VDRMPTVPVKTGEQQAGADAELNVRSTGARTGVGCLQGSSPPVEKRSFQEPMPIYVAVARPHQR
jgi:hypothetical protein